MVYLLPFALCTIGYIIMILCSIHCSTRPISMNLIISENNRLLNKDLLQYLDEDAVFWIRKRE